MRRIWPKVGEVVEILPGPDSPTTQVTQAVVIGVSRHTREVQCQLWPGFGAWWDIARIRLLDGDHAAR